MRHGILYINPLIRFVDFMIGVYAAIAFMKLEPRIQPNKKIHTGSSLIATISLIALIIIAEHLSSNAIFAFAFWPLSAALIFSTCVASKSKIKENKAIDIIAKGGSYIFSFYMIHQMVILVMNSLAHKIHFEHHFCVMATTLIITSIIAYFITEYFEIPVCKLFYNKIMLPKQ